MRVRNATLDDRDALQRLYDEHFAFVHSADRRVRRQTKIDWSDRWDGAVWVGVVDRRVVGYVSGWLRDDVEWGPTVWVDHMALDAHHPYPGLGRLMIDTIRAKASRFECRWIVADVPRASPIEQAFWLALGAQRVNRRGAPACDVMRLAI